MIVAMFWKQLLIQITVADSVADSKKYKFESATQPPTSCRLSIRKTAIIVTRVQIVIYAPGSETNQSLALFQK